MKHKSLILNVDDDEAGRYAITRELKRAGFEVLEAGSGAEALRLAGERNPDLILLDIRMPDTNGFEVCRRIREDPETASIPVMLLSASYLDSNSKVMGLDGGADAYLTEPVDPSVLLATMRSLLRLKRAEQTVRDSALQWHSTFNAIQEGVALLDRDGSVLQSNTAFDRILEPYGNVLSGVTSNLLDRLLSTAKRQTAERAIGARVLAVTLDPVFKSAGEISAVVCLVADVTEKKRFEQRLQHAQKLESIGVLAGGIAHDFNNLLTGILGNASLIMNDLAPGGPERDLVSQIIKASERAASLTRQLLAYSGKGRFVMEPVDLSAVALESRSLVRQFIPKDVALVYDVSQDLPAIEADPAQIQQIIINLIVNAAESFGEDSAGEVRVKTSAERLESDFFQSGDPEVRPGLFVSLTVSDNGKGMDREMQQKIFDPFFTTKFTGRGLGLSAVQGILRGHRGVLRLQSEPSAGTTFQLYFPAAAEDSGKSARLASKAHSREGTGIILVIDDESVVRNFAANALQKLGYDVITAENGQIGVEIFEARYREIALVILDLTMPVMNGEQTLKHLRATDINVPIVLSSGFSYDTALQRFEGQDLAGFIGKPYTAAQLAEVVGSVLKT